MKDNNGKVPQNVLFVCHANVCRSPMAEYIFNDMIARAPVLSETGVKASSVGILKNNNRPASDQAIMVMQERGLGHMSRHKSREIDAQIIQNADLILTMDEEEKAEISARFPETAKLTFMLSEFAGDGGEIGDPTGGSTETFNHCAGIIEGHLRNIIIELKKNLQ